MYGRLRGRHGPQQTLQRIDKRRISVAIDAAIYTTTIVPEKTSQENSSTGLFIVEEFLPAYGNNCESICEQRTLDLNGIITRDLDFQVLSYFLTLNIAFGLRNSLS